MKLLLTINFFPKHTRLKALKIFKHLNSTISAEKDASVSEHATQGIVNYLPKNSKVNTRNHRLVETRRTILLNLASKKNPLNA